MKNTPLNQMTQKQTQKQIGKKSSLKQALCVGSVFSIMGLSVLSGAALAQTGGVGTPGFSNPTAPQVVPNVQPNTGQDTVPNVTPYTGQGAVPNVQPNTGQDFFYNNPGYTTPNTNNTGSFNTAQSRPFPESSGMNTRPNDMARPASPGVPGSSSNEGQRPGYVPSLPTNQSYTQQAQPNTQANQQNTQTRSNTQTNTQTNANQQPNSSSTQAPLQTPMPSMITAPGSNVRINGGDSQPEINIVTPSAAPSVMDADDPLGRDEVYQQLTVNEVDDANDADALSVAGIPLWAMWSSLAILLAGFAAFATWWVMKNRQETPYEKL